MLYKLQSGLALLILLTILLLSSTAVLLTWLNDEDYSHSNKSQLQTARALAQAREALIGFAATYAETHPGQPQGYLPCPDENGDGDSPDDCEETGYSGHSVIGRFPWRTLGLPPLYDGSGECLWYAVSGTYKDNIKQPLTNSTPGQFTVKNANGNTLIGDDGDPNTIDSYAIAVVFAPGAIIKKPDNTFQDRTIEVGNTNFCGGKNDPADYLDTHILNGIDNSIGNNGTDTKIFIRDTDISARFWVTANSTDTPTFIQSPEVRDSNNEVTFNDVLMLITPKDFKPVYKRMNDWVAMQVAGCLEKYAEQYAVNVGNSSDLDAFKNEFSDKIDDYLNDHSTEITDCKVQCNGAGEGSADCECEFRCKKECQGDPDPATCKTNCKIVCKTVAIPKCESKCEKTISVIKKYPWASKISSDDYLDDISKKFGRIPYFSDIVFDVPSLLNTNTSDANMPNNKNIAPNSPYQYWIEIKQSYQQQGLPYKFRNISIAPCQQYACFEDSSNDEDYSWWWWEAWREEVFFITDVHHIPNASTYVWVTEHFSETLCSLSKIIDNIDNCPSHATLPSNTSSLKIIDLQNNEILKYPDFLVFVAGEAFNNQKPRATNKIKNYLEDENKTPNNNKFIYKWPTDDFNDSVCYNSDNCLD